MEKIYYAEGGKIWRRPEETTNPNGTKNITMGFPVCIMSEYCSDDQAEIVARLMNLGHHVLAITDPDAGL